MDIDLAVTARFLAALSPDNTHTFQTFDDAKQGRRGMTDILHGTLAAKAHRLSSLNYKGAGVFVMVNRGDGYGRKADNVIGCRALFLDLDGSPIEPVLAAPIRPRIVVESSPGKWHAYWPVVDLPAERFTTAQKSLAALYAGDPKVHDRPRVMRLPGFLHNKAEPFQSRLVECEQAPLTWQEMADAFDLTQRMTLPNVIPDGDRNNTLFKLAKSAASKGVPEAEQLRKALTVNATRCAKPLPDAEVAATVASAYRTLHAGAVGMPWAVLDSPAYQALDDRARTLLLMAYRRADTFNGGCVTLPWRELSEWFTREQTFEEARKRVVASGLLTIAKQSTKAMPRKGRGPTPTFYQLAIPPLAVPYSSGRIPPSTVPPEALQAVAVEGSKEALGATAIFGDGNPARTGRVPA